MNKERLRRRGELTDIAGCKLVQGPILLLHEGEQERPNERGIEVEKRGQGRIQDFDGVDSATEELRREPERQRVRDRPANSDILHEEPHRAI